jgi:uncharacterized paraquat-inducible protein A
MTTLPLARCTDCQVELQPSWKFCIACGTPVPAVRPALAQVIPAQISSTQPAIPAAIRPTAIPTTRHDEPRRRINLPVASSIVLGTAGVALIVYLLVVVFGSRD